MFYINWLSAISMCSCYSYPCFKLPDNIRAEGNPRVVISENCITSVGPSSALEFALKLVELLRGADIAKKVAEGMLVQ